MADQTYVLKAPKHLENSQWQSMLTQFMDSGGPDIEKYRPGAVLGNPVDSALNNTQPPPPDPGPQEQVGPQPPAGGRGSTREPIGDGGLNVGQAGNAGMGTGNRPGVTVTGPNPGMATGTGRAPTGNHAANLTNLTNTINETFPRGDVGSQPDAMERFLVENGDKVAGSLGLLSGVPGMGWLVDKLVDYFYWNKGNHSWSNLAPETKTALEQAVSDYIGEEPPGEQSPNQAPPPEYQHPSQSGGGGGGGMLSGGMHRANNALDRLISGAGDLFNRARRGITGVEAMPGSN